MPIIHKKDLRKNAVLGIWEVNETEQELLSAYPTATELEILTLNSFSHSFRRTQFLASRLLLETLMPGSKITYDKNGKPWLDNNDLHLSLSHTGNFIAILIDEKECGVDIETIRPKIEKIAMKFLSEHEFQNATSAASNEQLHVYWCVKEAIYKVYGQKNVSLKTDIFVENVSNPVNGSINATLHHQGNIISRNIQYEQFQGCMLAWTE